MYIAAVVDHGGPVLQCTGCRELEDLVTRQRTKPRRGEEEEEADEGDRRLRKSLWHVIRDFMWKVGSAQPHLAND